MFVICLIICFVFSLQAVAASDVDNQNVTLSDSDMSVNADVLTETNVNLDLKEFDTYNMGNKFGSSYSGETSNAIDSNNEVLKADNSEVLSTEIHVNGDSFGDIASAISTSNNGDIIFLNGGTFTGTGTEITIDKEITIIGGSSLTDSSFATLDANYQSRIFKVTANNVVIKNINFNKGVLLGDGAAVYWSGENGDLSNSNFNDNHATYSGTNYYSARGGAVYWEGKYGILSNSTFKDNTAGYGGAIAWFAPNGTVKNSNFTKNYARNGGAVYWVYEYGKLFDSNFINNNAGFEGGAIRWTGGAGNITYCNFTYNNAGEFAGGAVSFNSIQGDILHCNFLNNTAGGYGGAIRTDGLYYEGTHSQTIGDCTFLYNQAGSGGAIFSNTVNGTIRDSYFLNNTASGSSQYRWYEGGAILWDSWTGTLLNCTLINNTASRGGALSKDGADFRIINSRFINNSAIGNPYSEQYARGSGGAIFWLGAMGWIGGIYNSTVINNTANNDGGGIYVSVTRLYFHNTTFTNNSAGRDGGAIWKDRPSSDTWNSTFINNTAGRNGGAIWITNENNTIRTSTFSNNNATEDGGAIYITADGGLLNSIYDSKFDNNSAFNGGAIYMRSTQSKVYNSSFIINSADRGGAIYWFSYGGLLDNSTFDNNSALYGGAVYWIGSQGKMNDSNFTFNNATLGGAVYWTYYLYPTAIPGNLNNSRFVNNTADLGGAVYWDDDDGVLSNSKYINNTANYYGGAIYWIFKSATTKAIRDGAYADFSDGTYGLIDNSVFTHNKARNGSAIYSEKDYLSIEKVHFDENQAWSYLLLVDANPKESIYNTEDINITVEYIACDNIINAIWNNASYETIRLLNCSYTHSMNGKIFTDPDNYETPVLGAENSNEGALLYQDNHEYLQIIDLNITDKNGNLWYSVKDLQTDIYGNVNITIPKSLVKKGNNTVVGIHPEDWNYKFIRNVSWFLVTGPDLADLEVIKENDHVKITDGVEVIDTCRKGDIVYWTITVINHGPDEAINAVLKDVLPKGLRYISDDSQGKYDNDKGIWKLGDMPVGDTRTLVIKTEVLLSNATILNLAVVSSDTPDPNETNNRDNSSVPVLPIIDLEVIKIVDKTDVFVGDKVTFTITVINHGPDTAVNTRMTDVLPKGLKLVSFKVSRGSFDSATGIWSIGDLKPGESVQMFIVAEALITGHIINNASVISDTPEEDLSNNNDSAAIDVRDIPENHTVPPVEPVEPVNPVPKLHATGNPILMVLMALCAVIGITIRRKNL